ncbi:MAG: hypothetical protein JNK12_15110 [Acidimicrobiales bacterium]|nr:hypothetical protein [Acidimicrobiales bacterium]
MAGTTDLLRRRVDGTFPVDPWGLDAELVELLAPAARLRWDIDVQGALDLPSGPFVLVISRRLGLSEPWVAAEAVRRVADRLVRFVGVPDVAPVGPALRRLGAVVDRPDEIAGLLRAGEVVGLTLGREPIRRHHAGALHPEVLAPVVAAGVPVLPVAVDGRELGRYWRVTLGEPIEAAVHPGPLAVAELAEHTRLAVQALLDRS